MPILQVWFSFKGRLRRSDFWRKGVLPLLAIGIVQWTIIIIAEESRGQEGLAIIGIIIGVLSLWPWAAIYVKRWHDRDRSAWWLLTILIPGWGMFAAVWIVIETWFIRGSDWRNRFGPDPLWPAEKQPSSPRRPRP
jgi:uncharacterized membrane protein YhaH (DUF805 family)